MRNRDTMITRCTTAALLLAMAASARAADTTGKPLRDQVAELQAKVARLEAALGQRAGASAPSSGMGPGRGMGGGMGMGGMMSGHDHGHGSAATTADAASPGAAAGGPPATMAGMEMMGRIGQPRSAAPGLPGFPGGAHLYHVGAVDFFLDHADHVGLTTEQRAGISAVREQAVLDQASVQRKIDEAEQALWTLTAADQPDASKVEAKIHEIEGLRAGQRITFIRAIGEAAKLLTEEQRKGVLGQQPTSMPSAPAPGGSGGGMGAGQPGGMGGNGMQDM